MEFQVHQLSTVAEANRLAVARHLCGRDLLAEDAVSATGPEHHGFRAIVNELLPLQVLGQHTGGAAFVVAD